MNKRPFNMPRIAMYIWYFLPLVGGAEKQCKILSEELVKKGVSLFIITERLKGTKKFEIMSGIEVYRVSGLNRLRRLPDHVKKVFNLATCHCEEPKATKQSQKRDCFASLAMTILKSLSKFLTYKLPNYYFFLSSLLIFYRKRKDFDIIHIHESQDIACFGIRIARLLKKKVIIKELISGDIEELKGQSVSLLKRIAMADCFIAISGAILRGMISLGMPKEKIKKIPNGVNLYPDVWKNSDNPAICLTKINQLPNKGVDVLLKAWSILVNQHKKPLKLKVFGRGNPNLFDSMLTDLKIKDSVYFSGFAKDVKKVLLDSSLFVLPSRREGLSNSLLEAMSIGMPCIATDISGNQDLIQHGKNGLLVPSGDANALADAVIYMLDNPDKAKDMGYNARTTIEQQYKISTVADRYVELYRELIKDDKE